MIDQSLFEKDVIECLHVLHAGGIILYPTDTVWGIGCDATNRDAVEKIITLKKRGGEKSFVVLVAEQHDLLKYVAAPDMLLFDYLETVSEPVTVIYENVLHVAENVKAANGSVAIRVCKDDFCYALIKRFVKPIVSTSANISGKPTAQNFREITADIQYGVDYVVQHRQKEHDIAKPSAIIKWVKGKPEYLRY